MGQDTALLIVDVQVGLLEGRDPAFRASEVLNQIRTLIARARTASIPVIYMQHEGKRLQPGTRDWQIHPTLAPQREDLVITQAGVGFVL